MTVIIRRKIYTNQANIAISKLTHIHLIPKIKLRKSIQEIKISKNLKNAMNNLYGQNFNIKIDNKI